MRYRQVHLDFHTSEKIKDIGKNFSKEQFQKALKKGHVDSITLFSKCHHGWAYHPSETNEMHPGLSFDLLGAQISAAHEIGVKTPVYLSAGLDEKIARQHPEWCALYKDGKIRGSASTFDEPGYHEICMNTPYLDYLLAQIKEVCEKYDADGIFLDIIGSRKCFCKSCIQGRADAGMDPYDDNDAQKWADSIYENYCRRVRETVDSVKPGLSVFHNGGHIPRGNRKFAKFNTHLELESLPTGGYSYDHFPLSASYVRTLGMEYLGMTGKFHGTWGEFGGYKHPNALRYEVALSAACGARCSIGDQLHPLGKMDETTYDMIGAAYAELEKKEPWLTDVEFVADIALLSYEAYSCETKQRGDIYNKADDGAVRMLLEGKYLFNTIDCEEDFSKYKVIVLPDGIKISAMLKAKLEAFVSKGGKILATGDSGLNNAETEFAIDFGIKHLEKSTMNPDYFKPEMDMRTYGKSIFVMYGQAHKIEAKDCTILGKRYDSYFNRTVQAFCSHQHTPYDETTEGIGITENKSGIYISWDVFSEYATRGSFIYKEIVHVALDRLLGNAKTVKTNLPAQGIVTYTKQKDRFVLHALYASPVKRGNVEVIEDIIPMYNTTFEVLAEKKISRVYLAPDGEALDFAQENGIVKFSVPCFENHVMIVLE